MKSTQVLLYSLVLSCLWQNITAVKILAIFPYAGPSQYINAVPYLKELAARGHEVTAINAFPQKKPVPNFRDIPVMDIHKIYPDVIKGVKIPRNIWAQNTFFNDYFVNVTLNVLRNNEVQELIKSPTTTFDLIIVEAFRIDAIYGFAQHFNAPIIGFNTYGTDWNIDELVGNTSPISYMPLVTSGYTDRMSFWQRLNNLIETSIIWIHHRVIQLPKQIQIYKNYFPNAKVPLEELRKNFSLMLLNQHFSLSFPHPHVPNMIEVGGLHISHKPTPLPKNIAEFVEGAKDGVIYFSLGSNVQSKDLPVQTRDDILKVFGSLKQRVLWKFEDDQLPGKPPNVFIQKWFPQPDILAHPNVKLFITHGGLLSTIEAIHHGKPVLGLPVFYDQFLNVARATNMGFGLGLDYYNLKPNDFKDAIERLLTEPSFTQRATEMSNRYHDQPMSPMETAIWWTEYVLRHKGAPHMRVAAQDLSFWAYHSLDTCFVLFGGIILIVVLVMYIVVKVLSLIICQRSDEKSNKKTQ